MLKAVDWSSRESAHEVVDMLRLWKPLGIEDALGLLDCGFADAATRSHAVQRLNAELGDDNDRLCELLLQLVQVLKCGENGFFSFGFVSSRRHCHCHCHASTASTASLFRVWLCGQHLFWFVDVWLRLLAPLWHCGFPNGLVRLLS
jgi:hypothetical protein